MIVLSGSTSGSPGVTSWNLLLGAAWPAEYGVERAVVEAARDGGVLGARYPAIGVEPGVAALAAACRRAGRGEPLVLAEFGRAVADGVWVVPEPESAEKAVTVWSSTAGKVAPLLAADGRVWLVDGGRLGPGAPALAFAESAALALVWCGPRQEDLVQVPARVQLLQGSGVPVGVVVVGSSGYDAAELGRFFGTGLVWSVPAERDLPSAVSAVLAGGRSARRSWLWRQAVSLAADVAERVSSPVEADVAVGVDGVG